MHTILTPDRVLLDLPVRDLTDLFGRVALLLRPAFGLRAGEIERRLARRELRAPTLLGQGIALPHAHVIGLPQPVAVHVRLAAPMDLRAPNGVPVQHALLLLVPRPATAMHFELLQHCMSRLQQPGARAELDALTRPDRVWAWYAEHRLPPALLRALFPVRAR